MSYGRERSRGRDDRDRYDRERSRDRRPYDEDRGGPRRSDSRYRQSHSRSQPYRRSPPPARSVRYDRPRPPPAYSRNDEFIRVCPCLVAGTFDNDGQLGCLVQQPSLAQVAAADMHKETAGRIADISRHGPHPPTLLAIGHPCLYNAVQAIATARQYVLNTADRQIAVFDLTCQPAFRDHVEQRDREVKPSLALYLNRARPQDTMRARTGRPVELSVSGTGDPPVVAGALAARVREGCDASITAIGADAVAIGLRAICHARVFLERDGLDIKCQPESVNVLKEDRELRAIRFTVLMEKL